MGNLTPGAIYYNKNGQASVRVERRDSTIYITATCDSLQMLVGSQNRELIHLRTLTDTQNTIIEKPQNWWQKLKNNVLYIILGMAIMLVATFIIRIKR